VRKIGDRVQTFHGAGEIIGIVLDEKDRRKAVLYNVMLDNPKGIESDIIKAEHMKRGYLRYWPDQITAEKK
jgi:hypothetical protein